MAIIRICNDDIAIIINCVINYRSNIFGITCELFIISPTLINFQNLVDVSAKESSF